MAELTEATAELNKALGDLGRVIGRFLFDLLLAFVTLTYGGFVVSKIWVLTLAPLGVVPLGILGGVGILVLVRALITRSRDIKVPTADYSLTKSLMASGLGCLMWTVAWGWVSLASAVF